MRIIPESGVQDFPEIYQAGLRPLTASWFDELEMEPYSCDWMIPHSSFEDFRFYPAVMSRDPKGETGYNRLTNRRRLSISFCSAP